MPVSIEESLYNAHKQVEKTVKIKLLEKDMSQTQLAKIIGESRSTINLAIKGSMSAKSIRIRKEIYKILGIK